MLQLYAGGMTAEPIGRPVDPGRDPAAIRDMLPPRDRADFTRFYAEALEAARLNWSLRPVEETLEQWRRIAILSRPPGHAEAMDHGRRLLAGDDVPVHAVDLEALGHGDVPASWPTR
jgi:hypothetical protein